MTASHTFTQVDGVDFQSLDLNSPLAHTALLLIAGKDGQYWASGTATAITQNIAITAAHNVQEYFELFEKEREFGPAVSVTFHLLAIQRLNGRTYSYEIRRISMCTWTDIAVISLTLKDEKVLPDWGCPRLTLIPPGVGEPIMGFGVVNTTAIQGSNAIEVRGPLFATFGDVQEVHWQKRDSSRLPFPCFQTNARFDGSMSGGPVFDSRWRLCGIVCSNMPPFEAEDEHLSYVALLYPLMGLEVKAVRPGIEPRMATMLEILGDDLEGSEGIAFERGTNSQGVQNAIVEVKFSADIARRHQIA